MTCTWSPEHYREILESARAEGYPIVKVSEVGTALPEGPFFLVRHDIDISMEAAHAMALLEADMGITTCYYVRLHSPFYNALAPDHAARIREIADMGHEVGLHYEPGYYESMGQQVAEGIASDIHTLETLLGGKTLSVSQHEPSIGPVVKILPEGYPCAYQRHLVLDTKYFGDSGFRWREGCICEKLGEIEQIHTLIHPANWMRDAVPWEEVLRRHAKTAAERIHRLMEEHIVSQRAYLARRDEIDAARRARYDS
ncbi:MAG TPA: hypothetical protein ENK43_16610 [Planctomycetes bacterium]|nr:hypothetical protein [Planctomycetota bacterium]